VVRSNLPYETLVGMVRRSVRSINAEVPAEVSQLSAYLDADIATRRLGSILFLAFASIALVLYAGGLFGVLNHAVTQRYKELGIRMALGASAWRVRWLVVRQLLLAVGVGVVIGCVTSWLGATLISSLLFEISARDALTYAVAIALTAVVTVLASYLPARRATQVVPVIALRGE
ncbi:MAG: FtsX-like permease family protein, partial [Gemmatimonadales bacterium]